MLVSGVSASDSLPSARGLSYREKQKLDEDHRSGTRHLYRLDSGHTGGTSPQDLPANAED